MRPRPRPSHQSGASVTGRRLPTGRSRCRQPRPRLGQTGWRGLPRRLEHDRAPRAAVPNVRSYPLPETTTPPVGRRGPEPRTTHVSTETRTETQKSAAKLRTAYALVRGGGQGRGRTADLPLFRSTTSSSAEFDSNDCAAQAVDRRVRTSRDGVELRRELRRARSALINS